MADEKRISDVELVVRATQYAAEMHIGQFRKSDKNVPYLNHPIDAMCKLVEIGHVEDAEVLAAAVLHDTVEDCKHHGASIETIQKLFGERVAGLVAEVTDDKALGKAERKRLQIEHAPHKSKGAMLIKMADKLSNLGDMRERPPLSWDNERIQGYFVWAHYVLAPMLQANAFLADELCAVFSGNFQYKGQSYPCLPPADEMENFLERYFQLMENCSD